MERNESFPKTARLRRRREFLSVQRSGRRRHTVHFVVLRTSADPGAARLGITVSTRVGNAVARNRVKRVVREIFRRCRRELGAASDIVVIAKSGADNLTYAQAATELEQALELAPAR